MSSSALDLSVGFQNRRPNLLYMLNKEKIVNAL